MPLLIGITGNIGCGKSAVGKIFEDLGIPVIDSDKIAHEIYETDLELRNTVLKEFGTIERAELAKLIFGNSDEAQAKRKLLESIVHPAINKQIQLWVEENSEHTLLVNLVPLLFEAKLEARYHKIITVSCEPKIQLERLKARHPDWSEEDIQKRIDSQMPQEEKISRAHYVICNSGPLDALEEQVKQIIEKIK